MCRTETHLMTYGTYATSHACISTYNKISDEIAGTLPIDCDVFFDCIKEETLN